MTAAIARLFPRASATSIANIDSFATITLFSDPRVQVQSVAAAAVPGGFSIEVQARLR